MNAVFLSSQFPPISGTQPAFLWEECKRCFYLKVVSGFFRPRTIMPKIFTLMDSEMKTFYAGKRTEQIAKGMPAGVVEHGERRVESSPIALPGRSSTCFIKGKFDIVVKSDDGSYGVVDFKTSQRKAEHVPLYARQLHAYAYALEHPAEGEFSLSPVSRLGLLVFEPSQYLQGKTGAVGYAGSMTWIEVPRDDQSFMGFLNDVLEVLERPEAPPGSVSCEWCRYWEQSRKTGL